MREIKFRAFDKRLSRMVHNNDTVLPSRLKEGRYIIYDDENKEYLQFEGVVMQFTGLKDKNGKDIYEGDIIRNYGIVNEGVVKFGRFVQEAQSKHDRPYWCQGFYVESKNNTNSLLAMKWKLQDDYSIRESEDTLEVLGNIYKNPEMIK